MQLTMNMIILKKIGRILYFAVFAMIIVIAALIILSIFNFPGNIKLFSVQSGSMEPSIHLGSIVMIKPQDSYLKDDIITIADPASPKNTVTHRIVEVKDSKTTYVTKGDANQTNDSSERLQQNILGKVIFSIPLLGYPVSFAKTSEGLLILVVVPATVIITSEILSIKNETRKLINERKKRKLKLLEKVEVEIGEEKIKVENWLKKLTNKVRLFFKH